MSKTDYLDKLRAGMYRDGKIDEWRLPSGFDKTTWEDTLKKALDDKIARGIKSLDMSVPEKRIEREGVRGGGSWIYTPGSLPKDALKLRSEGTRIVYWLHDQHYGNATGPYRIERTPEENYIQGAELWYDDRRVHVMTVPEDRSAPIAFSLCGIMDIDFCKQVQHIIEALAEVRLLLEFVAEKAYTTGGVKYQVGRVQMKYRGAFIPVRSTDWYVLERRAFGAVEYRKGVL